MRAVVVDEATKANASALSIGHIAKVKIEDQKQALVKIKAFGLNRMVSRTCQKRRAAYLQEQDILQRKGNYPLPPQAPATLGVEFSGIIEETGSQVSNYKKGDEV